MPSGLSEAPNSSSGDNNYGGGSYDATNPDFGLDPTDRNLYNLPPVRPNNPNGGFDFDGINQDLANLGDYPSGPSYDLTNPTMPFTDMFNVPSPPPTLDKLNLDMQKYSLDALDAADQYGQPPDFFSSPFWKGLKKFGMFAASMHPATRTPMALYNMYNAMQAGNYGDVAGGLVNAVTKNPLAGTLAGMGTNAIMGKPMNSQDTGKLGGTFGGMVGSEMAGPLGGYLGQQLGQNAGVNLGNRIGLGGANGGNANGDFSRSVAQTYTNPNPNGGLVEKTANGQTSMSGTDATIASLLALYGYNQANNTSKENNAAIQAQIANQQAMMQQYMQNSQGINPEFREPDFGSVYAKMDEMYNPNGTIAQNLRTTLERKDAAAGRRSQYGAREVDLLARLAGLRAQAEPGYLNAAAQEANSFNSMAANDANNRRAMLQAAMQGQNGISSAQMAAIQAANQAQAARQQQQMQTLGALYSIGRDQGWWNNMFSGE